MPRTLEGQLTASGKKFAIVVSRWNSFIVEQLLHGAIDAIRRHGGNEEDITIAYCPGSFEIPLVVQKMAQTKAHDAVIALGAIIRGDTPHFDVIAAEATKGVAHVALDTGIPCIMGILTTNTIEQAIERAGTKAGNKGAEAAVTAIEMVSLLHALDAPPSSAPTERHHMA